MPGCRSVAGRLFHAFGPATEKLMSPSRVLVRGTVRELASASEDGGVQNQRQAGNHPPGTTGFRRTAT